MFALRHCRQLRVLRHNRSFCQPYLSGSYVVKCHYQINSRLRQHAAISQHQQNGQKVVVRCYTPQAAPIDKNCWNCKKHTELRNYMVCIECGHLQEVDATLNYFDLLGCSQSFDVEPQQLTRHFRQLQSIVHPDKFSNKSEREQINSGDWSSLINKAYKTLSMPIERGQYLLQLHSLQIPVDNSALDKEFLMEMMERNEEVENSNTEIDLRKLDERIVIEMNDKTKELSKHFNENDLNGATAMLVQMKYLRSLQKSIKTKLQTLIF